MEDKSYMKYKLKEMEFYDAIEFTYRRAYSEGFRDAARSFYYLLDTGMDKEAALHRCYKFRDKELYEWENGDYSDRSLPPYLKVNK